MASIVRAVDTFIFGEIVELPPAAYGATDTEWDPEAPVVEATSRNFPAERICPKLRLVHGKPSRMFGKALVTEFWYRSEDWFRRNPGAADPGPRYDCPAAGDEKEWRYARLLSKDSHYKDVGFTLLAVAVQFFSLLTQLQLTLQCMQHYWSTGGAAYSPRFWFATVFLLKLFALGVASDARVNRKLSRDPGDLRGRDLGWAGRAIRRGSMMLFNMFDVPGVVSDVLNLAHIHKPFQPFAVFRTGGSRVWIVGWNTRSHFRVDMEFSSMSNLKVNIIFDSLLFVGQFHLPHDMQLLVSFGLNIFASLLKLAYTGYKFYFLKLDKKMYHEYQSDEVRECLKKLKEQRDKKADPEDIKKTRGRARAVCRDLTYHFGNRCPYPHEELAPHPADQDPLIFPLVTKWCAKAAKQIHEERDRKANSIHEGRERLADPATEHLSPHPADQGPLTSPVI